MSSILLPALFLSTLITASPLLKRDYPAVGACSGKCQGSLHDPAVIYRDDTETYYRFTTNDGLHTATAPSIEGPWTDQGPALPNGSIIDLPGNKDLWVRMETCCTYRHYAKLTMNKIGSRPLPLPRPLLPVLHRLSHRIHELRHWRSHLHYP